VVVCSGVKSILDVGATLERLETLNVTVLGYGTHRFPASTSGLGHLGPWCVDSPAELAAVVRAREELGTEDRAVVVANPLPAAEQLDPELHDGALAEGLAAAERAGVAAPT
jgi:pseudouridylate synthase